MAQTKGLVKILQAKIAIVTSQKDQLHGVLDDYIHKMTGKAKKTLDMEEQDVNTLRENISSMETVWEYLVQIITHMEDVPSTTLAEVTDQELTQASVSSSLSSSLPEFSSTTLPVKSHDSAESQEMSKLHRHMEVLEIALTTCRNQISQANTDKNEVRDRLDKLENHIQKVETSHLHELDQKEERLATLEKLSQKTQSNITKEIKDLQKNFKDNIRKTKLELDTKMDSVDDEFQKTQEQNLATIKEQASKLGKVEKKMKKMKEEEQERWSQIGSIHTDVESLKDDQRNNQQLVKIQGLEKHMETLTSQCDSLQDRVGKIEPVMQMSQELAHKISTLATDEQVQELIQTTTATSRSLEELTSRVEDTERSVRGCVTQRERDENRRREMEDRVAVVEAQRQKDLDHYSKELEETNTLYKAVCQLVDQRVTPLRRLQRMLNDYHKQVEKREEISTRLDDVVKKVEDISTQLDKHDSDKEMELVEESMPGLTRDMEEEISRALRQGNPNDVLSEGFGLQITRRDMATLGGLNWLNDEIINFYMNMLMARGELYGKSKVYAFNTFFYPKIMSGGHAAVKRWTKKTDIFSMHFILIPVRLDMHWCLCVVDMKAKRITYYDSMGASNRACLQAVREYVNDERIVKKGTPIKKDEWQLITEKNNPHQMNGGDCGMFMCKYAEYITRGRGITFTQANMPYFRRRMVYEILHNKLLQ